MKNLYMFGINKMKVRNKMLEAFYKKTCNILFILVYNVYT
jgi:hypothetical protein